VSNGEVIHTKEFKYAYDIYKTEMGEPVRIKETRMKNLQVTLNVPVSKEEVQKILANQPNHDLQIEIADEFKPQLEDKFNITQTIDDMNTRVRGEDQEDRAVTETAEVSG